MLGRIDLHGEHCCARGDRLSELGRRGPTRRGLRRETIMQGDGIANPGYIAGSQEADARIGRESFGEYPLQLIC